MKESKRGSADSIPPELVPYCLLTPRERQVLQYTADGLSNPEIAEAMGGISPRTVEAYKRTIGHIGTPIRTVSWYEGNISRRVILALIQDGVRNGYIQHELSETEIKPLTKREDEILEAVSQGLSYPELAARLVVSIKAIEAHMNHVKSKLGTMNFYHTVARSAYLKLHGQWEVADNRGRRASSS